MHAKWQANQATNPTNQPTRQPFRPSSYSTQSHPSGQNQPSQANQPWHCVYDTTRASHICDINKLSPRSRYYYVVEVPIFRTLKDRRAACKYDPLTYGISKCVVLREERHSRKHILYPSAMLLALLPLCLPFSHSLSVA